MFKKSLYFLSLPILVGFIYLFLIKPKTEENLLIVGTNSGFPPYEVINENGELEGFDIDLAKAIAKEMNKKLLIKDMAFDALIISLQQGKIDLILAGMSITNVRKKQVKMVHYLGKGLNSFPLLFWDKILDGVLCIDDLKKLNNKTVCAQAGNIQEEFIQKYDFLEIKSLENISDLIMEIKYGKSIACVLEPFVVNEIQKKFKQIKVLNVPLDEKQQDFGNGIGIKKDNVLMISKIKEIVGKFKQDGTMSKLEGQWFVGSEKCL